MEKFKIEIANEIYEDYKQGLCEWNEALNIVETVLDKSNYKELQHYKDSTSGLYATDRLELIKDEIGVMFQLDGEVDEKNLINRVDIWCASSLDPETSQKWDDVKEVLLKTRNLLRGDS